MTNKVTIKSTKEPVRLRVKNLANGVQSLYLDCYVDGKRSYEFLKLYLIPEKGAMAKAQNEADRKSKRSHSTGCQRHKDDPYS